MVFRIEPKLPPQAFKTYAIRQPLATHWRRATCAEADCPRYLNGWKSVLDMTSQDAQNAALWIEQMSGLRFTKQATGPTEMTYLFPPGQMCARADRHRVPLGREPLFVVRGGDHRPDDSRPARLHTRAEDWRDDFGEQLLIVKEQRERG